MHCEECACQYGRASNVLCFGRCDIWMDSVFINERKMENNKLSIHHGREESAIDCCLLPSTNTAPRLPQVCMVECISAPTCPPADRSFLNHVNFDPMYLSTLHTRVHLSWLDDPMSPMGILPIIITNFEICVTFCKVKPFEMAWLS